jgi:GrpB-like predicted nucleotidyltransferase (UPF0157 family)
MKKVIIKPYDSKLPKCFKKEKDFLLKNLDNKFEIRHIGSSSVPGLGGKNFIDIQVLASNKKIAIEIVKSLESIGYENDKNAGSKYRIFFVRHRYYGKKKFQIHLHLMWKTSKKYKEHLMFRDYLRKYPKEAKRYYSFKKIWAKKAKNIRKKYTEMKTDYIKEVLKKVKKK